MKRIITSDEIKEVRKTLDELEINNKGNLYFKVR